MTATEKRQLKRDIERTNVIYDLTKDLTTEELKALTPALLKAAIPIRDALAELIKQSPHNGWITKIAVKALAQAKEE